MDHQHGALIDVDPRVEFLATSNNPAMERERTEMSATLVRVRAMVQGLVGHTHPAQRANLESYADKLAAVVHPIRFVPPEILSEVFSYFKTALDPSMTCQSVKDGDFDDSLNTTGGVWPLTHVCSRWRQIITTTTSFWTTVGLQFDNYPVSSATAEILATYLARSKQRDLNVILYSRDEISDHPAMDFLMETCDRWRGAWFALPLDTFLAWRTLFPFHQLRKLRVYVQYTLPALTLDILRCRAFGDAPLLVDIAVDQPVILHALFLLNWANVRVFTQEKRIADDFVQRYPLLEMATTVMILADASSLESAQFDLHALDAQFEAEWVWRIDHILKDGGRMIRNAVLSSLVLRGEKIGWTRLLDNVQRPNLQTLQYCAHSKQELFPDPLPFSPSLRELVVDVVDDTDLEPLRAFLNMTPDLRVLEMRVVGPVLDLEAMRMEAYRMPKIKRISTIEMTVSRRI